MVGLWNFLRQHVWGSMVFVVGGALTIYGFITQAFEIITLQLEGIWWALIGTVVVFSSVVTILYRWHSAHYASEIANTTPATNSDTLETIVNGIFVNETVPLDGKRYVNCRFESVTFDYNGGDTSITSCTIVRPISLMSTNEQVQKTMNLLTQLMVGPVDVTVDGRGQAVMSIKPLAAPRPQSTPADLSSLPPSTQ